MNEPPMASSTPAADAPPGAPPEPRATRPLSWSLRRELWENRSIVLAPLAVAAVVLLAALFHLAVNLPDNVRRLPADDPEKAFALVVAPFAMPAAPIMLACFLVGVFYSLDALYGERRDRSILFWKSLPVSDATTVLAKALVPIAALPLIALALAVATFFTLLAAGSVILLANGLSPAVPWTEVDFVQEPVAMLYGLTVHALWFSPSYAFLLLVSAWARRLPLLWAALPPFALAAIEKTTLGTSRVAAFLKDRFLGAMEVGFTMDPRLEPLAQLEPLRFLATPGLWLGLLCTAIFLAGAVVLRRRREPV